MLRTLVEPFWPLVSYLDIKGWEPVVCFLFLLLCQTTHQINLRVPLSNPRIKRTSSSEFEHGQNLRALLDRSIGSVPEISLEALVQRRQGHGRSRNWGNGNGDMALPCQSGGSLILYQI